MSKVRTNGICREDYQLPVKLISTYPRCISPTVAYAKHQSGPTRDQAKAPPNVVYAQLKFMWANNAKDTSLEFLQGFAKDLARDLVMEKEERHSRPAVSKQKLDEMSRLLARCYFKLGQWQSELKESWDHVCSSTTSS